MKNIEDLKNSRNEAIKTSNPMALCRCGGSGTKPFCNGTHARIGFSSAKLEGRVPDKPDDYQGKEMTIHDNRGVCAHSGHCIDNLSSVFVMGSEPWIDPDGAGANAIDITIKNVLPGLLVTLKIGNCVRIGMGILPSTSPKLDLMKWLEAPSLTIMGVQHRNQKSIILFADAGDQRTNLSVMERTGKMVLRIPKTRWFY